jgi:CDP-diacylglycerol--glycerol-3-phosphate 3-phosphatidyltransferase
MNLPTLVTIARLWLIPVFVIAYVMPGRFHLAIAALCFGVAALTDWLDGFLARRLHQTTTFGAFLDPVADKLIVVTALVLLIGEHSNVWLTLPGVVIVGREIVISALREWMAEVSRKRLIAVTWVAKVKTTLQMIALFVLLANPPDLDLWMVKAGYLLLYGAAIATLWSMFVYLHAAWPTLKSALATRS